MESTLEQNLEDLLLAEQPGITKAGAADILQNDISQTLSAVLLWLQTAMREDALSDNQCLQLAETHLTGAIKQLVQLHYAMIKEDPALL